MNNTKANEMLAAARAEHGVEHVVGCVGCETQLVCPTHDPRANCSLHYCAAPGYQNGVNCRAEQGFRRTSDDWCGCKCHITEATR